MKEKERCFACGKALGRKPKLVSTRDDQNVYVGSECYKKIKAKGAEGYRPPGWPDNAVKLYDDFKQ